MRPSRRVQLFRNNPLIQPCLFMLRACPHWSSSNPFFRSFDGASRLEAGSGPGRGGSIEIASSAGKFVSLWPHFLDGCPFSRDTDSSASTLLIRGGVPATLLVGLQRLNLRLES
jgi:hypothetical protein